MLGNLKWREMICCGAGVLFVLAGCQRATATYLEPLPEVLERPVAQDSKDISVFFTQPDSPSASTYRGGPDKALAEAIQHARYQVDIATYRLDLWSVRDALLQAHRRGVGVRVVTEGDHYREEEIRALLEEGIPVIGDQGQGLMHHKFVVIDQEELWTGSMNFTVHGAYRNDNNLVHIRSRKMAKNFTVEFEEMFEDGLFGEDVRANTPYPSLMIGEGNVETYFSPDDQPLERILELLGEAEEEILFFAYAFTSDPLAEAMIRKTEQGLDIQGVLDSSQSYTGLGGEWERFKRSGLDVRLDGNPMKMHHKCILIDRKIVISGSYNFTKSAENFNDENVLIFHDPGLARDFIQEFNRVYGKSR